MKKLSLEMLRLTSDEVLERSQMKKITGGYMSEYYCYCISPQGRYWPTYGDFPGMNQALSFTVNRCGGSAGCILQ